MNDLHNKNYLNKKVEKVKNLTKPKRNILINVIKAFVIGGLICSFAQVISVLLELLTELDKELIGIITIIIMIFLGSITTGFGLYDRLGQFAGAGSIVPITGFANSMTSSAIESKSEGLVLGILTNVFKLAGSVIIAGVVSGFIVALIKFMIG